MTTAEQLPPLPQCARVEYQHEDGWSFATRRNGVEATRHKTLFTADQMQAYARAALAAAPQPHPVQEPVAWYDGKNFYADQESASMCMVEMTKLYPLYTSPQAQPLTHLQAKALVEKYGNDPLHLIFQTEAAHGITKGTT